MPNFTRNLLQLCTLWVPTGTDIYNRPTFAAPVKIACRWEDISELVIDKRGQEITSKSRIFLAQDVDVEGYLRLTPANDTNWASHDPLTGGEAFEIRQVKRTPNLRDPTQILYTVWL